MPIQNQHRAAALILLPGLLPLAMSATAQDAAAPAEGDKLEEVIVTAQRREEKLQEVPIAVTALSAEQVENRGIQNVADLSALAPGLQISKTASNSTISQITIRGLSQINPAIYWDPAVGVYVDGVYIGKAQGGIFDIVDLERVEVLRGPQGTLYGRNTLAGAINLITRKPSGSFAGSASLEIGNFNAVLSKASVDLPKMGIVSLSLAVRQEQRDGWVHTASSSSTGELNNRHNDGLRLAADFDFAPGLLGQYRFDRSNVNQTPNWDQLYRASAGFFTFVGYPTLPSYASQQRQEHADLDAPMFERAHITGHSFTLSWDVDEHNTLKSISGFRQLNWDDSLDIDGSPMNVVFTQRFTDYHQLSQDLQWLGHREQLQYVAGVYYFGDKGNTNNPLHFFDNAVDEDSRYGTKSSAVSGYGQIDYKPLQPLTLSAGIRYTREKKELDRVFGCNAPFVYPTYCTPGPGQSYAYLIPQGTSPDKTFSATTPMASIAYQLSTQLNTYLRYAEGFKSGGFNGEFADPTQDAAYNIGQTNTPFKPEKQRSFEWGVKSNLFDSRLQLNTALFYNKAKDLQESLFLGGAGAASAVRNAGKATIYGAELEGAWAFAPGSRLGFNYAYLHPRYDEFIDASGTDQAHNRAFVHAPKNSFNAYVDARLWRLSLGELRGLLDYAYQSDFYTYAYQLQPTDPAQQLARDSKVNGHGILNARLALANVRLGSSASGEVALWCRNVLDDDSATNFIDFGPGFGSLTVANFEEPRTYGITGVVRW
ncbi:iron complex outermembrane recepter protein [Solimonas aquatica]|uniref:Iron complex outermembrane recepter protein n=1 Tax=Solimonas aquatica TaxID=489703 RepID=A0A1H9JF92_9GAMM|nr:TonB-dependent receptor [Solimonas aquatica]SEQ85496.1 iron complex outermembrane recepter protein [Solimonas aquatica]